MAQNKQVSDAMRRIQEDIRTGRYSPCYLLYGTESYLIRQYRRNLANALIPEGDSMNLSCFQGTSFDEQAVIDLAETMPFFNDHRLIIMEDSGLFRSSSSQMADYLSHIPESTIFLFTEYPSDDPKNPDKKIVKSVDKRNRVYKAVAKYGFAAELNTPSSADLTRWTAGLLRRENKRISEHTLQLFLSRSGSDMNRIRNDLEKLLSYTIDRDTITDADVEAICGKRPEDHIFQMIDAISEGRRKTVFSLYADLCALRTPPGRILYLISDQYANLLRVKELKDRGMSLPEIESETGLRRFAAEKCSRISNRYTEKELQRCLDACVNAEESFKTGKLSDQISLELLITELLMQKGNEEGQKR